VIDDIGLTSPVVLTANCCSTMSEPVIKKMLYTLKLKSSGAGVNAAITEPEPLL